MPRGRKRKLGRRAHGEGSVFYRPDRRRWMVRLPGESSARSFKTEKDATDHLITARQQQRDGTLAKPSTLTLAQWWREWLDARTTRLQLAPSSVIRYQRTGTRIAPIIGTVKLRDLQPRHVDHLLATLEANGETRHTLQLVFRDLRCALRSARRAKLLAFDPSVDVDPPQAGDRPAVMRSLDETAARAVVAAAKTDHEHGALWLLGLTTGMRRGELLALTWSAVDLAAGVVTVERGIQRANAGKPWGWRVGALKTAASRRELALTPETIDALRSHQRRQKALRLRVGRGWEATGFVFQGPDGGFLTPDRAACAYRRFIAANGLPVHRLHDLRHTHATLLLRAGEAVHVVAKQLGHASAMITLKHYAHALPDQRKGVASRMSALLAG